MVNTVQHKRGTNAQVNSYTGDVGEFIYNTTTKRIHTQDGVTAGGFPHALVSDVNLKANASVTISAGSGLTGGGTLAANRTIALSSASIASLALADSAVQSVNGKTGANVSLNKADVGLSNVDNTSDENKPVSTATQTALNAKANSSVTITAGAGLTGGGNLTANRTVSLDAASIASLAKADTALQAPGGATGQVLAKNSATDNDVAWVNSEAATAVSYGPQTLTPEQQEQARQNIAADIVFDSKAALEEAEVSASTNAVRLNGYDALGDGNGGLYIDTDNGSNDTIVSGDGRTWYRVKDVGEDRISSGISDKIDIFKQFEPLTNREIIGQSGFRVPLSNPPHLSSRVIQGVAFDNKTGELYSVSGEGTDFVDRVNTVVRHDQNGVVLDYATGAVNTLGHAQGLNLLYFEGTLTFISQNDNGDGLTAFTYDGDPNGGSLLNLRNYKLTDAGINRHTTIGLSADKKIVSAYYKRETDDKFYVRLFDVTTLLNGSTGDRSKEYINEICLSDIPEFDGSAASNQHCQGCTSEGGFIYTLHGYWQIDSPKYLYIVRAADGSLFDKIEITAGKSFASTMGTGTTYEPEDLEWVIPRNGGRPTLFMGMRVGGAPNNNWFIPLGDYLGAMTVNGDTSPLGIGLMFSGGSHDIVYRGLLKFGTISTSGASYTIEDNSGVNGSGRWWTKDRFVASREEFANIGDSTNDVGASLNYWGGISATRDSGNTMVLNRLGTDGAVSYFYKSGVLVGSIAVTGSGTSYNQTSDATVKIDRGELTFEDAKQVLELIAIHNFTWTGEYASGGDDIGIFAQELYEVYPRAVSVGGWFLEDGSVAKEGDAGANYIPWGVDYSKLIPVIVRVLQGILKG